MGYLHTSPEYAMKRLLAAGIWRYLLPRPRLPQRGNRPPPQPRIHHGRMVPARHLLCRTDRRDLRLHLPLSRPSPHPHIGYREAFARYVGIDYSAASLAELRETARKVSQLDDTEELESRTPTSTSSSPTPSNPNLGKVNSPSSPTIRPTKRRSPASSRKMGSWSPSGSKSITKASNSPTATTNSPMPARTPPPF